MGERRFLVLALILVAACADDQVIGTGGSNCSTSKDCEGGVCDPTTAQCVDCLSDADCLEDGTYCAGKVCEAKIPCTSDKQCAGQLCDGQLNYCVDCSDGADCPSAAPYCVLHVCSTVDDGGPGGGSGIVADAGPGDGKPQDAAGGKPDAGPADTGAEPWTPPETCTDKAECDDGNPCTKDACTQNTCSYGFAVGADCDDGDACTELDACLQGGVCEGVAKGCADGNPCTKDACDPSTGDCGFLPGPDGGECDDGNDCTDDDRCQGGKCKGDGLDCDDDNQCTTDGCDAFGECLWTKLENGTPCDDGSLCTETDWCKDGGCIGQSDKCDDQNPCTIDSCDGIGKCTHSPVSGPCDDGDLCTVDDICEFKECKGLKGDCADGNPCTKDSCDPVQGCVYDKQDGIFCSDGDLCTDGDICKKGVCVGTPADCDDGKPCTDDVCTPGGFCSHAALTASPGDPDCSDGKACTTGDHCETGICTGLLVTCAPDGNPCTSDSCDPASGTCYKLVPATCNDENDCTQSDMCSGGQCVGQPKNSGSCFLPDNTIGTCSGGVCTAN